MIYFLDDLHRDECPVELRLKDDGMIYLLDDLHGEQCPVFRVAFRKSSLLSWQMITDG
jgi:hypothetical protein